MCVCVCACACVKRFFKLGRSRDVIVYRLLAEGTIEEALYIRENHKEVLHPAACIFIATKAFATNFTY